MGGCAGGWAGGWALARGVRGVRGCGGRGALARRVGRGRREGKLLLSVGLGAPALTHRPQTPPSRSARLDGQIRRWNRQLWGTHQRASPLPSLCFGIHAAKALLSGPEGSLCRRVGLWGGGWPPGLSQPRAVSPRCRAHWGGAAVRVRRFLRRAAEHADAHRRQLNRIPQARAAPTCSG